MQLEKEKAEIERLREEGSKSARGRAREDKDKLEGLDENEQLMSHTVGGGSMKKLTRIGGLDAVRETD